MYCPNCGTFCEEGHHFCSQCGTALSTATPARKHAHRVPLLILCILSALGILLFFLDRQSVSNETAFEVQSGVLSFHEEAYHGPTDVTIATPDQELVFSIGDKCFSNCDWMTSVQLPDTVQVIGSYAFQDCTSLRGIQLPASLEAVGPCAFSGCTSLEAIVIPSSVAFLAENAFENCDALSLIFYGGTCAQWRALWGENSTLAALVYCSDGVCVNGYSIPTP